MPTSRHAALRAACMFSPLLAALPAAGIPDIPNITLSITNQGPAFDNFGDSTTGWTGYLISASADDPTETIRSFAADTEARLKLGILGTLLQDWSPTKGGFIPSAVRSSLSETNGGPTGTDSHLLALPTYFFSGTEDNDLTHPTGAPANIPGSDVWGTGQALHGVVQVPSNDRHNSQPLAYVVTKDSTAASYHLTVADKDLRTYEFFGRFDTTGVTTPLIEAIAAPSFNGFVGGIGTIIADTHNPLHCDTATFSPRDPSDTTIPLDIRPTGLAFASNINGGAGTTKDYIGVRGFQPDLGELFALNLKINGSDPTGAQVQQLIADINANNIGGAVAQAADAQLFPDYDLMVTTPYIDNPDGTGDWFAFDFSHEANVQGVIVTDIAAAQAVPEASMIGVLAVVAIGLRRRRASRLGNRSAQTDSIDIVVKVERIAR